METQNTDQTTRPNFFGFISDVNLLLASRAGISYSEVAQSLHPGGDAPRHAAENGVEPADFVAGIMQDEGFIEINDEVSLDEARDYNRVKTAIAEFVFVNPEWHRTSDGIAFAAFNDDVLMMKPVQNKSDHSYGFGVEIRQGAIRSDDMMTFSSLGTVEAKFAGFDIAKPLNLASNHINSRNSLDL